jgi:hypothetical protein
VFKLALSATSNTGREFPHISQLLNQNATMPT